MIFFSHSSRLRIFVCECVCGGAGGGGWGKFEAPTIQTSVKLRDFEELYLR